MDRNDVRTNIRIRLSKFWRHHNQNGIEQYHRSIEGWETTWDGSVLSLFLKEMKIAEVNKGDIYLSETVHSYFDIPLCFLELAIAQSSRM
ncbi:MULTISPECIES: hypothetical protein [unclassified Sporosarcina]|uniref:hypothetical protein n=1 Tax=unclassified Sporosarcina TaxID=2647733 RepID=UPI001A928A7B|nr:MULTISPECIES: hypothetical protein [unclassified Sporosarcina]MBO0588376.1 hypothetical protein [Sporosarcina sp. E16_8]MBO0603641.1 hypothetical protein [Sporosarcina sp. E16_3]